MEDFCRDFLSGDGLYDIETDFAEQQESAFKMLRDNEKGTVNMDELSKFLWELTRIQISNL